MRPDVRACPTWNNRYMGSDHVRGEGYILGILTMWHTGKSWLAFPRDIYTLHLHLFDRSAWRNLADVASRS